MLYKKISKGVRKHILCKKILTQVHATHNNNCCLHIVFLHFIQNVECFLSNVLGHSLQHLFLGGGSSGSAAGSLIFRISLIFFFLILAVYADFHNDVSIVPQISTFPTF